MRLLEFAQLANNTLGTVDTARSLVTRPQGNGSVSALSQQIDYVGTALTSEIRGARDVLQQDIRTVSSMVSQVSAQQAVLRQEIHQVIAGVARLNVLLKNHMHTVEDQLRFMIEEPVQNACYQLTAHLTNKEGVGAMDEEIRGWLRILESWISKNFSVMRKTLTMSSEDAAQILLQSPDNIAFIVSRLHLLFGDIIPEKFRLLPPVSLKFYFLATTLFLKGLEKNPHLMGADKAQNICLEIQNTLNTYLAFSSFLKNNPAIIEALFRQYDHLRDALGRLISISNINKTTVTSFATVLATNPLKEELKLTLVKIEEIRLMLVLLSTHYPKEVSDRSAQLESANQIGQLHDERCAEMRRGNVFGVPFEHFRMQLRLGFPCISHPKGDQSNLDNLLLIAAREDLGDYKTMTEMLPAYRRFTMLHFPTYQSQSGLGFNPDNHPLAIPDSFKQDRSDFCWGDLSRCTSHIFELMVGNMYADMGRETRPHEYLAFFASTGVCKNNGEFFGHMGMRVKPNTQYRSMLDNSTLPGILNFAKLKTSFKYYLLLYKGKLKEADEFLVGYHPSKTGASEIVDPYCLLFHVAMLGRWDIFETYQQKCPLPTNFNFSITVENSEFRPIMIAAFCGRQDVVCGLLHKINPADLSQTIQGKTAAQLAREQGFEDIAVMIERAQRGILPSAATLVITKTSDYVKALEDMRSSVSISKTKLGQYVPPPPVAQQAALSTQAADPLPGEETDEEEISAVEKTTRKFFNDRNRHAGRVSFWNKPTERRYRRTGFRIIENAVFENTEQRGELFRALKSGNFIISRAEELDGKLLVELGTKKPAII